MGMNWIRRGGRRRNEVTEKVKGRNPAQNKLIAANDDYYEEALPLAA